MSWRLPPRPLLGYRGERAGRPDVVEVMGRYSNPDNVFLLRRILSRQGRDRPSHRPVPSVRQKQTRLRDSQRSELLDRYLAGDPAT